jgi:pimeloyl-ACP methyl ester carboxylesterase
MTNYVKANYLMKETVVVVHGLWMTGIDMLLLRRRLRGCGFNVVQFAYPTMRNSIAMNAAHLYEFTHALKPENTTVHFIGHSLGGLVILRLFQDFPDQCPGRVVLLGTPCAGSFVARQLASYVGRWLFGRSLEQGLLSDAHYWNGGRDLGVIAGNLRMGGGMIVRGLPRPNDGTVAVQETHLLGMTEHITLPVSHTGLLFSSAVVRQACTFLKTGRFDVIGSTLIPNDKSLPS